MSKTIGERLAAARQAQFVGREAERALFAGALAAAELPFYVLYIFGPGGVGKTALLHELERLGREAGAEARYLDGRHIEPSPAGFQSALQRALELRPDEPVARAIAAYHGRHVILIDTYETLAPLDGWLRDVFVPELPGNLVLVLAGRHPPTHAWRSDPGWQALLRILPLRNLDRAECHDYLNRRQVATERQADLVSFTHGHPLALSLTADVLAQDPTATIDIAAAPDMVHALVQRLMQDVPGPAYRQALEVTALVNVMSEPLLATMLERDDVHELFEWLRGLSIIDLESRGVFLHDLARDVLAADLRWRNPDRYMALHERARHYYMAQLATDDPRRQRRVLQDYIFLHRENPIVRPFFNWQTSGTVITDVVHDGDDETLLAQIARHEGVTAAELAAHWLATQPAGVVVFRDDGGAVRGGLVQVALEQAPAAALERDPATRVAWRWLARHAPLRAGERATYFRFWLDADEYQGVSPVQTRIFLNIVQHYLTTPGLAFTFIACADAAFWMGVFTHVDLARLKEVDFEVDGRRFGVFGHDWRVVPPLAWLGLMGDREMATAQAAAPPAPTEQLLVLSESDFAEAVRDALRYLNDPQSLRDNPLLRSRLIVENIGEPKTPAERIATLQTLVRDAVESLQQTPRQKKFHRALYHTYIHAAPTQEQAAELLDLPFSTYRRHLRSGVAAVAERLWVSELGIVDG